MLRASIRNIDAELITYSTLERDASPRDYLNDPALFWDELPQPYRCCSLFVVVVVVVVVILGRFLV
jgi:hypothetical protein